MKLSELLLEYNANPFVPIVSFIDLRIREVEEALNAGSNKIFIDSLRSQLRNLLKFVESASNWNIPEKKLRADFHGMLPPVRRHVEAAVAAASSGSISSAKDHLMAAREITIARSHLKFGDIE